VAVTNGYAQVAPDSTGKRIANFAIVLPVGTLVSDADGTQTALSAATTVFVQRVALTDSSGNAIDDFIGNDRQGEIIAVLRRILAGVSKICGDEFLNNEDQEL
jgi:hypothetical protein